MDKLAKVTPVTRRTPARAGQVTDVFSVAGLHLPPANDNGIPLERRVAAMAPWIIPAVLFTALLWLVAA